MADRNEDGTSKNEVDWGVPVQVYCSQCGEAMSSHGKQPCGKNN